LAGNTADRLLHDWAGHKAGASDSVFILPRTEEAFKPLEEMVAVEVASWTANFESSGGRVLRNNLQPAPAAVPAAFLHSFPYCPSAPMGVVLVALRSSFLPPFVTVRLSTPSERSTLHVCPHR